MGKKHPLSLNKFIVTALEVSNKRPADHRSPCLATCLGLYNGTAGYGRDVQLDARQKTVAWEQTLLIAIFCRFELAASCVHARPGRWIIDVPRDLTLRGSFLNGEPQQTSPPPHTHTHTHHVRSHIFSLSHQIAVLGTAKLPPGFKDIKLSRANLPLWKGGVFNYVCPLSTNREPRAKPERVAEKYGIFSSNSFLSIFTKNKQHFKQYLTKIITSFHMKGYSHIKNWTSK